MENNFTDFDTTLLDQLEDLTTDPLVERIFTKAREIEEMVNSVGDTTVEERMALIADLDAMWPYDQLIVPVSGRVTFPETEVSVKEVEYCDESPMISQGFVFASKSDMQSGAYDSDEFKIALYFLKHDEDDGESTGRFCFGMLDETTIDYPAHSIEMIENRLRYFNTDLMQELDHIVLNCDTEEAAVMALAEFSLSVDTSNPDDLQLLRDVQNYLNSILGFDRELPYRLEMGEECYVRDGGLIKPAVADEGATGLVGINGVQFMPEDCYSPVGATKKVLPCIETKFFSADKDSTPSEILVPTKSIRSIASLRREMYE